MASKTSWRLVLASGSPRRKELLARTGVSFDVVVSSVAEESTATNPSQFALDIAGLKASAVAAQLGSSNSIVVASDTVVALGEEIFGKPQNSAEAREFLLRLSGKTHQVLTAVVIIAREQSFSFVETTSVTFAAIAPYLLERYIETGDSLDKAGGYGIQGDALAFIRKIDGCYGAVVGFPLARFCAMMEQDVSQQLGWNQPWQNYFL